MILIFSGIAINYFFAGLDVATTGFLRSQALLLTLDEDDKPVQLGDITVAAHWKDLPQPILHKFNEAELIPNQLSKEIGGLPIFSPPKHGYFVIKVLNDSQTRYVSLILNDPTKNSDGSERVPIFFYTTLLSSGALIVFSIVLFIILRRVTTPIEKLKFWAKSLNEKQLKQSTPDFHYTELNMLAELIKSSLKSVQESVEREQRFLGYASHELRTPIAVTRTNAELLRKMIDKNINQEKQLEVLNRIERAGLNMTDLTETLLWLNRREDKELPDKKIVLGDFIKQLVSELDYLLQGKSIELKLLTDTHQIVVSDVLCRIILTNLIRNAFQHTVTGSVLIEQVENTFSITNQSYIDDVDSVGEELGFGLGLELTEKLISKYGWDYETKNLGNGRLVEVKIIQ